MLKNDKEHLRISIGDNSTTKSENDINSLSLEELKNMAFTAEVNKEWEKSLDYYYQVLNIENNNIDILNKIVEIEFHLGNYQSGAEALKKISELEPDNASNYYKLSQAYSSDNKPDLALKSIKKALELDPKNTEYLEAQASIANWSSEYDIAKNSYKKLLDIDPKEGSTLLKIANVMNWTGDSDEAVHYYNKYLELEPKDSEALLNLAKAQSWRGNYDESLRVLDRYKNVSGSTDDYLIEKSRALTFAGRPQTALNISTQLADKLSDNYDIRVIRTFGFLNTRRFDDALVSFDDAKKVDANNYYNSELEDIVGAYTKSSISLSARFYHDTDDIDIFHENIDVNYFLSTQTSLSLFFRADQLTADSDSPFSTKSGDDYIFHNEGLIGIKHFFNPNFRVSALAGLAVADDDITPTYSLFTEYWPKEYLKLSLTNNLGYYLVSPLSVDEEVKKFTNIFRVQINPLIGFWIDSYAGLNFFTDDNRQWEVNVNPRKEILRMEHFDFDLGLSGYWFGYDKNLSNGYFDPQFYQRYLVHGYGLIKLGNNVNVAISGGIGVQEDNISDDFDLSSNISAETFLGIYKSWYMRLSGSYFNTRLQSGAFDAVAFQISFIKRF